MKKIEKIKELHESSIALIKATDLESIKKTANEDYNATVILTTNGEEAHIMGAGNTAAQAALIATFLEKNKKLMFTTLNMLMINN